MVQTLKVMLLFIVVSEDWYGDVDYIEVFTNEAAANEYIQTRDGKKDWIIITKKCPQVTSVFVIVSEAWYGGGENIQVFTSREQADYYLESVSSNEDHIILEKTIRN